VKRRNCRDGSNHVLRNVEENITRDSACISRQSYTYYWELPCQALISDCVTHLSYLFSWLLEILVEISSSQLLHGFRNSSDAIKTGIKSDLLFAVTDLEKWRTGRSGNEAEGGSGAGS
jgi:hypothetical protein